MEEREAAMCHVMEQAAKRWSGADVVALVGENHVHGEKHVCASHSCVFCHMFLYSMYMETMYTASCMYTCTVFLGYSRTLLAAKPAAVSPDLPTPG